MMVCHCGSPAEGGGCNGLAEICLFCFELWQAAGEPELCPCDEVQDEFTNLPTASPTARPEVEYSSRRPLCAPVACAEIPSGRGGGEPLWVKRPSTANASSARPHD